MALLNVLIRVRARTSTEDERVAGNELWTVRPGTMGLEIVLLTACGTCAMDMRRRLSAASCTCGEGTV